MRISTFVAALAIAALGVSGCAGSKHAALTTTDTDARQQAVDAGGSTPADTAFDLDTWANTQIIRWMDADGLEDLEPLGKSRGTVVSWWGLEREGLKIETLGGEYNGDDLRVIASSLLRGTAAKTVIAESREGHATITVRASDSTASAVDPEKIEASAIADGRPAAAYDIQCQVWKMPEPDTSEQAWAYNLGAEFLESENAECPDPITFPDYFIESFHWGDLDELLVEAEADLMLVVTVDAEGTASELAPILQNVFDGIMDANPGLEKVTATLPGTSLSQTATRADMKGVRELDARDSEQPRKSAPYR